MSFQPLSDSVYSSKYQLFDKNGNAVDKDREDSFLRVAKALAKNEKDSEYWTKQFFDAMKNGAIPAGRIFSNAGAEEHKPNTSLINCTVSDTIYDSIESIGQSVKDALITLSGGSGLGYDFSSLRPKGAFVNGVGAHTSGPLPFADIFDKGCFTIASAGGRRGAQMATFDLRHPDVLDFIKVKREDGRFRQFNISVLIPQSFFNDEKDWVFRFPIRSSDPTLSTVETMWDDWHVEDAGYIKNEQGQTLFKIYGRMLKSEIWDLILKSNYEYAEPGVIFVDRLNEKNNLWFCEVIKATNPCVVAGTQILTKTGYQNIETLIGQHVDVWNGYEWSTVVPKITGEDQKVLNVQFSNGSSLTCTLYHRFKLQDNITIEAQDLKLYDKVSTYYMPNGISCENIEVIKIEDAGIADKVYCFNEPKRHTAVFNRILTLQCGEQALPPNGSCLLGSIDLTKFVVQPFTDQAFFDFGKFSNTVDVFTRMLDNVVEFNNLPLEAQRQEILRKRRHGMGFFGLGSALTMLCIHYDSKTAIEFAEKVTKLMALRGYITGCKLAKEKGCAPILEEYFELTDDMVKKCPSLGDLALGQPIKGIDLFLQSPYMQRLLQDEPQLKRDLFQYGCRFSHHTSIAPTGTISLALGNNTCVAEGSLVDTNRGKIPIEDVKLNDLVKSFNFNTKIFEYVPIKFTGLTRSLTEVFDLELENGTVLKLTHDHLLLVNVNDGFCYKTVDEILTLGIENVKICCE